MAKELAPKRKNKKMATSNVSPVPEVKDPSRITGTVSKKVDNPFTGDEIVRKGIYDLQAAQNIEQAYELVGQDEKEVLFWFNHGRRTQAKQQMLGLLDFDLGDEKLNDLFKSFRNAMNNIVTKDTSAERREAIQKFILSEDKFEPIREKLDAMKAQGIEDVKIQFASPTIPVEDENGNPVIVNGKVQVKVAENEIELRKPTGKKGRAKKVDPNAPVTAETSDSDTDEDETEE